MGGGSSSSSSLSFEQRKAQRARGGSKREFKGDSNTKGAAGKQSGGMSAEARKKVAAEAAKEQARLASLNSKIMSGDWQVQVQRASEQQR